MLWMVRLDIRGARTWGDRGRPEAALSLPISRTTTADATKSVLARVNLMIKGKTMIASATSPCFESNAMLCHGDGGGARWEELTWTVAATAVAHGGRMSRRKSGLPFETP